MMWSMIGVGGNVVFGYRLLWYLLDVISGYAFQ
jgi:hypothetical protein